MKKLASWIRQAFDFLMGLFDSLFEEHKFVRRTIVFVSLWLIVFVVTDAVPRLEGGDLVKVVIAVIGFFSTVVMLYKWLRERGQ